jgi:hypothetical protein
MTRRTRLIVIAIAVAAAILAFVALTQPTRAFIVFPAPEPDCAVVLCAACPEGTAPGEVPPGQCCPACVSILE